LEAVEPTRRVVERCREVGIQVNTDQCVLGTLTDAYNNGWDCVLIDDACGTTTELGAREVCLYNIANSYGFVTDSKSIVAAEWTSG